MRTERILYIHSGRCTVYDWSDDGFSEGPTFHEGDAGAAELRAYLQPNPDRLTAILADIVEEEHYRDAVPKLNLIDQRALLKRRISKSFSRTRYRNGEIIKGDSSDPGTVFIRMSGITHADAIRTWTAPIEPDCCPIVGIFTPAVLSERILKAVGQTGMSATLIATTHSDGRIRHTYFKGSCLIGSRRFRGRMDERINESEFIVQQVQSSLRFFNPSAAPGLGHATDVVLIGGKEDAELDEDALATASGCRIRCVDIAAVAKSIGMNRAPSANQGETLFLSMLRKRPGHGNFAPRSERHYGLLKIYKRRSTAAAWALACLFIVAAGINMAGALRMQAEMALTNREAAELPVRQPSAEAESPAVDSLAMRAAVTSYRELLRNAPRPEPLLQIVSAALSEYPDIQIDVISWQPAAGLEAEPDGRDLSVSGATAGRLMLSIGGSVASFSGNYEQAFDLIDGFVATLIRQSNVDDARATRMPLDVNPQISLEGEVASRSRTAEAKFELQVIVRQAHESA